MKTLLPVSLVLIALAPAVAHAQTPTTPTTPTTPVHPKPDRVNGKATLSVEGGVATKRTRYFAPAQEVVVRGIVKPYVPNEVLTLYAIRGKKSSKTIRRHVGKRGAYEFRFRVGNAGPVRLVVKHRRSAAQEAFRTRSETISVVNWSAGAGSRGLHVLLLQRGLLKLGFATPVTGYFDGLTANAVNVFRKTNEMGRDGYATTSVYAMVLRGQGAFKLRYPTSGTHGKHVEFDWSRQVLVLADHGKPYRVTRIVGQALDPRSSAATTSTARTGDELPRHGLLVVLRRRIRHPRLRIRPELRREPRLPASADPERRVDLQLDRRRRPDLHVSLGLRRRAAVDTLQGGDAKAPADGASTVPLATPALRAGADLAFGRP